MPRLFPPLDSALTEIDAPVTRVTVLEDRAQVRRQARLTLGPGRHRLVVHGVSPVVQNVSLLAELAADAGRVADIRARRAWRILAEDRPEEAATLEKDIEEAVRRFERLGEQRTEASERLERVRTMIRQARSEIPIDAAWGRVDPETWRSTFEALFTRARQSAESDLEGYHGQLDLRTKIENLIRQRQAIDRMDTDLVGWLGVDVDLDSNEPVELGIEYVVPCALWRPIHTARWAGGASLEVATAAVLWQNTGEDWTDVELHVSTSRASLGHEPPRLSDDPLAAERKEEEVKVEIREVEVQQASVEGADGGAGGPVESTVELPGVDDGGQRRHIVADGQHTVPSDGRPVRVPLGTFEAEADGGLVTIPEVQPVAVWRVVAKHKGQAPLLAGPVELVRDHGPVGWTETRFVAPGATFELGYGPDEAVRVERKVTSKKLDRRADEWPVTRRTVRLFLSNLIDEPRRLKVVERIPVSEVDEVRITLEADPTTEGHSVDDDGFVTWLIELEARGTKELRLQWTMATAPSLDFKL